jgi:pyruvate/2-oxoglutarate/acetoin dehydrogenase E1 component/pyruvate/2-oxoglutarate dehydrogenase complex dihydrolipoamide acyltransferase (E2) component
MVTGQPRLVEELNGALHRVLADTGAYLLGEDVIDPYGGAFGATQGLSTAFPRRVLSTPISENGIFGAAAGLALCGDTVIVEVMFGDFLALAFDQLLNFITKSVSMYGRRTPMRVVARCPVGGGRGYGPTHSQSMQKYFLGIPHLALYELTPFHDPHAILAGLAARTEPSILFEDKILYTERRYRNGRVDENFEFEYLDGDQNWAWAHSPQGSGPVVLLLATGGTARRALKAAGELAEDGLDVQVLVPGRLYPPVLEPVLPLVGRAESTWVVEESTPGGTWGAEIAARLHEAAWESLRQPVRLVHSADRVIPTAPHLERMVLLQPETIRDSIRAWRHASRTGTAGAPRVVPSGGLAPIPSAAEAPAVVTEPAADPPSAGSTEICVPKLNSNDEAYVVDEWLVEEGAAVSADDVVVVVETSKAAEEIVAGRAGIIHIRVPAGREIEPGAAIAFVDDGEARQPAACPRPEAACPDGRSPDTAGRPTPQAQRRLAEAASRSHRQIPPAFALIRVCADAALERGGRLVLASPQDGVTGLVVRAVASCRADFPLLFGALSEPGKATLSDGAHIAVVGDHGPDGHAVMIRDAERMNVTEIRTRLAEPPSGARRGAEPTDSADDANIALSVHMQSDLLLVQEIIPPQHACTVSLTGISTELGQTAEGDLGERRTVGLGLTYDHRLVNGREANAFLTRLKSLIEEPEWAFAREERGELD